MNFITKSKSYFLVSEDKDNQKNSKLKRISFGFTSIASDTSMSVFGESNNNSTCVLHKVNSHEYLDTLAATAISHHDNKYKESRSCADLTPTNERNLVN